MPDAAVDASSDAADAANAGAGGGDGGGDEAGTSGLSEAMVGDNHGQDAGSAGASGAVASMSAADGGRANAGGAGAAGAVAGMTADGGTDANADDPCDDVTCDMPPEPSCVDDTTRQSYAAAGTCANGRCEYAPQQETCMASLPLCSAGRCVACLRDNDCAAGTTCTRLRQCEAVSGPVSLVSALQYPSGLWVRGHLVYYTETAGRNTASGGAVRLSTYDIDTGRTELIKDSPINSDAIVVGSTGSIFLASYKGSIPGESGAVSVVDPTSKIETAVTAVPIAAIGMYLDAADNIYVIGSSDSAQAKSLLRLPAGDLSNFTVVGTGFGRARSVTMVGDTFYFTRGTGGAIQRVTAGGDQPIGEMPLRALACRRHPVTSILPTLQREQSDESPSRQARVRHCSVTSPLPSTSPLAMETSFS